MKTQASALVLARVPRVNLMPGAEIERRARESLARRWLIALVAIVAAVALACAAAVLLTGDANPRVAVDRGESRSSGAGEVQTVFAVARPAH